MFGKRSIFEWKFEDLHAVVLWTSRRTLRVLKGLGGPGVATELTFDQAAMSVRHFDGTMRGWSYWRSPIIGFTMGGHWLR